MRVISGFLAFLALFATPLAAQSAADNATGEARDDVEMVADEDPEMNAAIAEANRTLPQFVTRLKNPREYDQAFAIKFPLAGWEHIWVGNLKVENGHFTGTLDNDPINEDYKRGDAVKVPFADVSDWAYFDGNTMQGHRTTRVLLDRIDPAQAAQTREYFGWK